jgi:hypothetical protein
MSLLNQRYYESLRCFYSPPGWFSELSSEYEEVSSTEINGTFGYCVLSTVQPTRDIFVVIRVTIKFFNNISQGAMAKLTV